MSGRVHLTCGNDAALPDGGRRHERYQQAFLSAIDAILGRITETAATAAPPRAALTPVPVAVGL